MRLNPGYVRAHAMYGRVLGNIGRSDEAISHLEPAQSLDPLAVTIALDLGGLYSQVGRTGEAMDQFERELEIEPESPDVYRAIARTECAEGRYDAAFVEFDRALRLSERDPGVLGELGYCYTRAGRPDDARGVLSRLEASGLPDTAILAPALIHVGLDDADGAFVWLERAYDARASLLPAVLNDARYASLHGDPRFADLLRRMGARKVDAKL